MDPLTIIGAVVAMIGALMVGYQLGKQRMARSAMIAAQMVQDGEAVVEDGTIRMADPDPIEAQREMAPWQ